MPDNEQVAVSLQGKLTEVEEQIAKLMITRNVLKELLGQPTDSSIPFSLGSSPATPAADKAVQSDSFHRMRVGNAAVKYLGMVGRPPRPASDIAKALNSGGLKVSYPVLYKTLVRLQGKRLEKVGETWGLIEWYDKDRSKAPVKPKTTAPKKSNKAVKAEKTEKAE